MGKTLRSAETKARYSEWLKTQKDIAACPLCERGPIHQYKFWKIIDNHFPYDRVAKTHHILVTLRHVSEMQLSAEERAELLEIKRDAYVNKHYGYSLEATPRTMSLPDHFHIHLLEIKDFDD